MSVRTHARMHVRTTYVRVVYSVIMCGLKIASLCTAAAAGLNTISKKREEVDEGGGGRGGGGGGVREVREVPAVYSYSC